MKTGDRVRKAIEDLGSSQSEVARRCSVTPQSVRRWIDWLNDETITDEQWLSFARGLRSIGLKPEDFKPLPVPKPKLKTELVPLLDTFRESREVYEALVTILTAEDEARQPLLLLVQDRLRRMK